MGSPNGIWTAVSGGMAQSQNLDIIANNLANINTTGFKKDTPTFKEYLTAVERPDAIGLAIPRTIFKDSDFYQFDGREHAMVNIDSVKTDHSQGSLKPTGSPFDLAIQGKGFFAVQSPNGISFTRAGEFKINGEGILVTSDGFPVLKFNGTPPPPTPPQGAPTDPAAVATGGRDPASLNPFASELAPVLPNQTQNLNQAANGTPPAAQPASLLGNINLTDAIRTGKKVTITDGGKIFAGTEELGQLAIAEFPSPDLLKKESYTAYSNPNPQNVPRVAKESAVHQGFLEGSNVNPVSELVDLLKANRMYESNMRAIKAYNDMAGKEANEVGKL